MDIVEAAKCFMWRFIGIDIVADEVAGCSMSLLEGMGMDMGVGVALGFCIPCDKSQCHCWACRR